ncbi:GNAT family N-acetyltransferase [Dactylosporangium sp. NPDC049525]|uniref:GNAT family N-acetyltransferase n=1 Tax=Dactylosporangium sp. NPDC049525 TaxID=3154730 RepID=UPI003441EFD7
MDLRRARAADVDALVAIHQVARRTYYGDLPFFYDTELLREAYTVSVDAPDRTVLCIDGAEGHPVGFLALGPPIPPAPATTARLVGLYVDPAHWQRGVGGALHDAGVDVWQAAGVAEGHLEVWDGNERAKAFYLRRGWQPFGEPREGPLGRDFVHLRLVMPASTLQ